MQRRRGSLFLETVIYISVCTALIITSYSFVFMSMKICRRNISVCELREIAATVEDRIRYEIKNSIGTGNIEPARIRKTDKKYIEQGYTKTDRYNYVSYDLENITSLSENIEEPLIRKNISVKNGNIYIGKTAKYQIGNYVDSMYIKKIKINKKTGLNFIITYKYGKNRYISRFVLFTD